MSKPYFVSFIEEAVMNLKYRDYIAGRIEVYKDPAVYDIEEIRFFTNKQDEYFKFRDRWDFEDVSQAELDELRKTAEEDFYEEV